MIETPGDLGPVVQSIVSLTSSLRGQLVKCFKTLLPNTLIFFVEKMREAFALHISDISIGNFNETLTEDVVSFEQPGPGVRSAMGAPSQLPGRGPSVVDMAPIPAR